MSFALPSFAFRNAGSSAQAMLNTIATATNAGSPSWSSRRLNRTPQPSPLGERLLLLWSGQGPIPWSCIRLVGANNIRPHDRPVIVATVV